MTTELVLFALLLVASIVAMLARWVRIPYTVALVLAGLALGALPSSVIDLDAVRLTPELLFQVFLPLLLFEAAFHLSFDKFRANIKAILLLAVPGVVMAVALSGFFEHWLAPLAHARIPIMVAMLFSAMLAATDPVSVIGLFKEIGVPKRLAVIVEGESLLNDAVGVVAFIVVSAMLGLSTEAHVITPSWLARFLLWEIGMGLLAGLAVGLFTSWLTTLIHDHLIEIMLTTVAAFGAYLVAHALHASPVLAVVASGMACGNVGARYGMTPANRIAVESFWDYAVFAANSFVFLLLGKEIDLHRLVTHAGPIAIAWLSLMAARFVVVRVVELALMPTQERLPTRWWAVLVWGGLRGSLSMVLALSIPATFEHRELLIDLTYGVVLISILVQGVTLVPVLRWAKVIGMAGTKNEYATQRADLRAVRAALRRLDEARSFGSIHDRTYETLRDQLGAREVALGESLDRLDTEGSSIHDEELRRVYAELMEVERQTILNAVRDGTLPEDASKSLLDTLGRRTLDKS